MPDTNGNICPLTGTDSCRLKSLEEAVSAVTSQLTGFRKDMSAMDVRVTEHHRTLYGNGKIGLKEGVDKMTVKVGALLWLNGIMVATLLGNLIAAIAGAYR